MEVLKSGDAPSLVTNLEVMQLLRERLASRSSTSDDGGDRDEQTQQQLLAPANDSLSNANTSAAVGGGPFENRDWIESTVFDYLRSSPCGEIPEENLAKMVGLVERLRRDPSVIDDDAPDSNGDGEEVQSGSDKRGYGLTDAETLQILNHMPTSLVEVHLLIEDVDKRENLKEEHDQLEFLKLISNYSGKDVQAVGDGASAGEEEAEDEDGGQDIIDDDDDNAMEE
ncbi:hypothetical protein ACHAXS_006519 [Conticribra weissflogii]